MKNRIILVTIVLLLLSFVIKGFGQDSLKVYVVGYFKNESFRIFNDSIILILKPENSITALQGFTFNIQVPQKDRDDNKVLNIVIKRKTWYGFYRDVKLYIPYESQNYLIINRTFRTKKKYSFNYYWTCAPPKFVMNSLFWNYYNRDWSIEESKENNSNGKIDVYDYMSYSWFRRKFKIW